MWINCRPEIYMTDINISKINCVKYLPETTLKSYNTKDRGLYNWWCIFLYDVVSNILIFFSLSTEVKRYHNMLFNILLEYCFNFSASISALTVLHNHVDLNSKSFTVLCLFMLSYGLVHDVGFLQCTVSKITLMAYTYTALKKHKIYILFM